MRYLVLALLLIPRGDLHVTSVNGSFDVASVEIADDLATCGPNVIKCSDLVDVTFRPRAAPRAWLDADVEMRFWNGDALIGSIGDLPVTFDSIDSIRFLARRDGWPKAAPEKRDRDLLITPTGDRLQGAVSSIGKDGITFVNARDGCTEKMASCAAIYFVKPAKMPAAPGGLQAIVHLVDGSELRGRLVSLKDGKLVIGERTIDTKQVAGFHFRNGAVVHLSDIPAEGERVADRNFLEGPLTLDGREFLKGLGVHSGSRLTFNLGRGFKRFEALAGLDDVARKTDSPVGVVFKVIADGKTLFEGSKGSISVSVEGVEKLVLAVDAAEGTASGNFADWALARVIR